MAFSSEPPNKSEAMSRLGAAYAEARNSIGSDIQLIKLPSGLKLDSKAKGVLDDAQEVLEFLALGVDMVEYQFIPKFLPHTSITMSGDYQSVHWRTYDDLDEKTFDLCVNFVETLIKKAEDLARKAARLRPLTKRP